MYPICETHAETIERLRAELREITEALDDERINNTMTAEEVAREMRAEIERLRAERDRALDRIAAMAREAERTEVSTAQALERRNLELHGEIKRLRAALDKLPGRIVDCTDVQSILDETGEPQ